jgi:4-hydroxybenzoate polyprenyltransferase
MEKPISFHSSAGPITKVLDCFFLLRIPLLAPVWTILLLGWITGPTISPLGGGLAAPAASCFDGSLLKLWIALASFSLVVASIYVVNQIADIESDRINHKLFILPHGLVSVRTAWGLSAACAILGLAGACFFDLTMVALFAASLLLGALYDLPPASLKNHALGGLVANFLGHGMITFLVGWHAASAVIGNPLHLVDRGVGNLYELAQAIVPSLSAGFGNAAVYITTTIPDAAGDIATGKKTFCVKYGQKNTALWASIMCAGALLCAFSMRHNTWVMVLQAAISLIFFARLVVATDATKAFQAFKWPVFLLSVLVTLFVPMYGAVILATFFGSKLYYRRRFHIDYPTFKAQ